MQPQSGQPVEGDEPGRRPLPSSRGFSPDGLASWRARKEAHVARLRTASPSVRLVVAADKIHNARSIERNYRLLGEELWGHFHGGRDGTLWYFRAVLDALAQAGRTPIVEELERAVTRIEALARQGQS